jgi:hypothetical protein
MLTLADREFSGKEPRMGGAERYESNADYCEARAAQMPGPHEREAYLELARRWRRLAGDVRLAERRPFSTPEADRED